MSKIFLFSTIALIVLAVSVPAQNGQTKGIDTQTQKIKDDTNKTTSRENDVSRSWNFGKDKTKVRPRIDNPIRLNSRRDVLVENIVDLLREKKIIIDEAASRLNDGLIVTQPFIFAKGAVITKNELTRYALVPMSDVSWIRGRYSLTIEVQSIDGIQNNVAVTAKIEGLAGSGLSSEWTKLESSGAAEEEFLVRLVEAITGVSPNEPVDSND
ncbi:MAG: hypothetical protein IPK58_19770 [Acidobacteria bacterium]|nr:hypothetical protein [Acidobacteriota bacterium]